MALKVRLKPGECVYVGSARIVARSPDYTNISIEGTSPVLRERDYIHLGPSPSPARRLYFQLQLSYLADDFDEFQEACASELADVLDGYENKVLVTSDVASELVKGNLYRALKAAGVLADL